MSATQPRARLSSSTTRRRMVLGTVAVAAIILVAGGIWLVAGGAGPGASPSPSPTTVAAASPTPGASPTEDVYPNAAETALLAALPPDLKKTCSRGSYGQLGYGLGAPVASISCEVPVTSGVNEILVRGFKTGSAYPRNYIESYHMSNHIPEGDCATSTRAYGRWERSGKDVGSILCYVDLPTGDAILYWTYDDQDILVRATNQRGDSAAMYAYFQQVARFISP